MNKRSIGYWAATGLFATVYIGSGIADVLHAAPVASTLAHLGFPIYLATILGPWKIAAAITLLAPRAPRLKEWAYAGIVFDLTGALASHAITGDSIAQLTPPIVLLCLAATSYIFRPASRASEAAYEDGPRVQPNAA
jgi:hypothetical protein